MQFSSLLSRMQISQFIVKKIVNLTQSYAYQLIQPINLQKKIYLLIRVSPFMKARSLRDEPITKPQFLQKFAGKLNIMTKHGQIKDENEFKLPLIKTTSSQRSNTHMFTQSKQSLNRYSSDYDRNFMSKSAASHNRGNKIPSQKAKIIQIQKCFRKGNIPDTLKLSRIRPDRMEPFSAIPLTKKTTVSLSDQFNVDMAPQIRQTKSGNDYNDFLSQLDKVSSMMKNKRIRG